MIDITAQVAAALRGDPDTALFDYQGRAWTRAQVAALATRVTALLDQAGVGPDDAVGVVVRNRPQHAAAMLGLISSRRAMTTLYAMQSPEALARDVREGGFAAIIADTRDWSDPVRTAADGLLGIRLAADGTADLVPGRDRIGPGPFRHFTAEPGIEILSSGTTGKPKRILFPFRMLVRAVESVTAGHNDAVPEPEILTWPYGGIGGMCNLVASAVIGRHTTLFDKFNVAEWADAVRRRRPRWVSGPPAVARMVLDAQVPKEDLASVECFYGGGAPMPPALQTEFEETYGIKVIWAYGATEFCGTVVSWTPALYERYRDAKLGAMGKALPGISLRVVDTVTGAPLPADREGYLEALVPAVSADWIRTTDLALIDADGFVFHRGRGDGAILRGGFKVLPEKVAAVLQSHPAVLDAAVVGLADHRLGQVPVAAVEARAGMPVPTEADLLALARRELVAHHVPIRVRVMEALPRTASLKVDLAAVRRLFEEETIHG
ncbi:MAG: class I adenylate-forming enzyme family protein [Azospirillaceae bacterium]|nr:class I adenylate-forming enzyme family protein [Azospirillaceae bacterium]